MEGPNRAWSIRNEEQLQNQVAVDLGAPGWEPAVAGGYADLGSGKGFESVALHCNVTEQVTTIPHPPPKPARPSAVTRDAGEGPGGAGSFPRTFPRAVGTWVQGCAAKMHLSPTAVSWGKPPS